MVRQAKENAKAVINVAEDAHAPRRPATGERMHSFDLAIATTRGKVDASIEVTSIKEPLRAGSDIGPGVQHATDKLRSRAADHLPIPGEGRVTIMAEIGGPRTRKDGMQSIASNGDKTLRTPDGRRRATTGD